LVLSNLAVLAGDMAEAEEWLEQVLDEYPDDISAMNDLGYLWADQNKHLDQALAMIRRAVEAEPENAAYRDSLGWVLFRLGRFDEAIAELEKAAAIGEPDAVILDHLGDAYQAAGRVEQAREAWRRAAEGFRKAKDEKQAAAAEAKIEQSP
jgi:Flp pilus assembly protein TadD